MKHTIRDGGRDFVIQLKSPEAAAAALFLAAVQEEVPVEFYKKQLQQSQWFGELDVCGVPLLNGAQERFHPESGPSGDVHSLPTSSSNQMFRGGRCPLGLDG